MGDFSDIDGSLARFETNGFTVLPKGTVPPEMVSEALRALRGECGDAACHDTFLKTKVFDVVTTLLGADPAPVYGGWYQSAPNPVSEGVLPPTKRVMVEQAKVGAHIDTGHGGPYLDKFDLLVGIPLTTVATEWCGNFGVCPGSHVALAKAIEAKGGYDAFTGGGQGIHHTAYWNALRWCPVEKMPSKALCVEAGQPYIAHQMTIHFAQANLFGTETRQVLYFRVHHPEHHGISVPSPSGRYDKEVFVKPFKNYSRLGGKWT